MKTGQHFFDQLPKDIQAKFKANVIKQRGIEWFNIYMELPINTWGRFLGTITWADSIEKHDYWYNLYKEYTKHDYAKLEKEITKPTPSAYWSGVVKGVIALAVICMGLIWMAL